MGSYTPMKTLFPFLVAALEVFNRYLFSMSVRLFRIYFFIKTSLKGSENGSFAWDIADKWMHHHDSTPGHTALSVTEFFISKGIPVVPQPPNSPDLSPCDFFLFHKLKNVLKGHHFGTSKDIQKCVTDMLKTILVDKFQRCNQKWEQRLHRCVAAQGNYFEEDNIYVWKNKNLASKKSVSLLFCHT